MKKTINSIIAWILTLCLTIAGLWGITALTRLKTGYSRDLQHNSYYKNPDEYDVLFLGTSHMMHGINPLIVWNETGITSYNWASPTCTIPMMYWKLNCILETSKPDLVVVDCFRASWSDKGYNVERMHEAFDAFPLSLTKREAVCDLMDDDSKFTEQDRMNMLFLLGAYHTRWEELQRDDFKRDIVDVKGCEFNTKVAVPIDDISSTNEKMDIADEMTGVVYLRKIIEKCQEENIDILLTYLPYPTSEEWKKEANMISEVAEEYGVDYINFTDMNIVNYYTDFADSVSHMNHSGQIKATKWLGKYIAENYSLQDKRDIEEIASEWDVLYDDYMSYRYNKIKNAEEVSVYLMLCYDLPLNIIIDIRETSIADNVVFSGLLEQLGIDVSQIGKQTDFILRIDGKNVILNDFRNCGESYKSEIGEFSICKNDDAFELCLNGEQLCLIDNDDYDMKVYIMKNDKLFDSKYINYSINEDESIETINFDEP